MGKCPHGTVKERSLKKKKAWGNTLCGERYGHWNIAGFPLGAVEEFMWKD